jgi:hypothetical protein
MPHRVGESGPVHPGVLPHRVSGQVWLWRTLQPWLFSSLLCIERLYNVDRIPAQFLEFGIETAIGHRPYEEEANVIANRMNHSFQ